MQAAVNPLYRTPWAAYTNSGVCLRAAQRNAEAETRFARALQIRPAYAEAVLQAADLELATQRGASALKRVLDFAIRQRRHRGSAAAWLARGRRAAGARHRPRSGAAPAHGIPGFAAGASAAVRGAEPGLTSMSEAGNEAQASGLGERLARARERRGLALLQAAEKLHLEPRVVEALESEDFDSLGAAVYVRGHLQRYAELVGENAAELQALYAGRPHAHSTPDLRQVITERNRGAVPGARFGVWQGGLLTLALVLTALVWWALRSSGPVDTDTVVVQPPPADAAATPAAGVQGPAPATAKTRSAAAPVGGTAHPSSPAPRVERPTTAAPLAAARPGEPSAALTTTPALGAAPAIAPAGPATAAPAANAAKLVLSFREDSWAEVYDASGAALYRDIATAGAVQTVSGVPPLRLVLGNAAGVGIDLDGRTVTLGAALQSTPNARFMLDRGGRRHRDAMQNHADPRHERRAARRNRGLAARLKRASRELLTAYGYEEMRVPMVEHTELFKRSIGEVTDIVEKEMYTFADRNGDSLTLRPEGTAGSCARRSSNGLLRRRARCKLWYRGPDVPPRAAAEGPLSPVPPDRRRGPRLRRAGHRRRADRR